MQINEEKEKREKKEKERKWDLEIEMNEIRIKLAERREIQFT